MADQETSSPGAISKSSVLKISVLASGRILLDGREVTLDQLAPALAQAKIDGAVVQYHRENPAADAPPEALEVLKLISANRLRISLDAPPEPEPIRPSNVIEFPGIEGFLAKIRRLAAGNRGVSLVRPDQTYYILPIPAPGAIDPEMVDGVKALAPSDEPRNIAAIAAPGSLVAHASKAPTVPDVARRVPFLGLLVGLAYVGHAVWIFDAAPTLMPAGCEDADILIVDSDAIAALPSGWSEDAAGVMRNPNILVYDRARHKVGAMRTAGEVPGRVEFPTT